MLGIIGKIRNEVTSSVKAALKLNDQRKDIERPQHGISVKASSDAANELLARYKDEWTYIRQRSEAGSESAAKVDVQAQFIKSAVQQRADELKRFAEELRYAPSIQRDLVTITERISALHELCIAAEDALVMLEDACEQQDLARLKESHVQQLASYRHQRHCQVEDIAVKLAEQYTHKKKPQLASGRVRRTEGSAVSDMAEREKYYAEAFKQDLERFGTGELSRPEHNPLRLQEAEAELARVELDNERTAADELDQFLTGTSPPHSGATKQHLFTSSNESAVSTASLEWDCTTDRLAPKLEETLTDTFDDKVDTDDLLDGEDMVCSEQSVALLAKQEVAVVGPLVAAEELEESPCVSSTTATVA